MVGDADGSAHLELRLSARIGLSGQQRRRRLQADSGSSPKAALRQLIDGLPTS